MAALTLSIDRIGYRPSGATEDKQALIQRTVAAVQYFGKKSTLFIESPGQKKYLPQSRYLSGSLTTTDECCLLQLQYHY